MTTSVPASRIFAFVSYKREDLTRIRPTLRLIEGSGCAVWYDRRIPGGVEWDALIESNVRACRFVILLLTQAAADSKHVRREVKFADKLDKPILTVLFEDVELGGGLDMLLSQYQMIDVRGSDFESDLMSAVRYLSASSPPASLHALANSEGSRAPSGTKADILEYMRGKPDIAWTQDRLTASLAAHPRFAAAAAAIRPALTALIEEGYLTSDEGRVRVTERAIDLYRRQNAPPIKDT